MPAAHRLFRYAALALTLIPAGRPYRCIAGDSPALDPLSAADAAITAAIADHKLPGGVFLYCHKGTQHLSALGARSVFPEVETMTADTIFDAASLTKVIATTPCIMKLVEAGKVKIDDAVTNYIPAFAGNGRDAVTLRHLLTHTSGLRPDISSRGLHNWEDGIASACKETLRTPPGTRFVYSDINFILLGEVVRRVSGRPLEDFARDEIFSPLKMTDTGFLPPGEKLARIAPTTRTGDTVLRGVVHDPTARGMGGVAGHAGLFTTAADLARYARMYLNNGGLDGVRLFKPETIRLFTTVQTPEQVPEKRGLGWDIDSPFASLRGGFPVGSFGHTGWTGTSLWIDPASKTFWILLSNRNHPTEDGTVVALRRELGRLCAQAAGY